MPKPVKIKKAKSFMFTTKHHSFSGVMGCVSCLISIGVMVSSIYLSFRNAGRISVAIASTALFAVILDFLGIICGITALSERDIHKWVPVTSIIANIVVMVLWISIVIYGK